MIVELILTPRQTEAIDDLERLWQAKESTRRWDVSDQTCERLLAWLRDQSCITEEVVAVQILAGETYGLQRDGDDRH